MLNEHVTNGERGYIYRLFLLHIKQNVTLTTL